MTDTTVKGDIPRELAAAMAETRQLRALVAEILDDLEPPKRPERPKIAKWRERAGLEARP